MTAVVLLGAGRGSRFGGGKLKAELVGKPLARHAADQLLQLPLARFLAVCSGSTPDLPGFERVTLDPEDAPLSRSIATGISTLDGDEPVLIALADMPLVPAAHFRALLDAFSGNLIATCVSGIPMVPAIFGTSHFGALQRLSGDRGAGLLLHDAPSVELDPILALDVDTTEDLALAEKILRARA